MQRDVPFCDGGGHHIAARLNLVGDDGIVAAVQGLHAVNLDDISTCAVNVCTHHIQKVGKVHNVRLTRNVFQHGGSLGQHGGQHSVHRCTDRNRVKKDMAARKVLRTDMNLAVLHRILRTEGGESLQMLVNGARAQIAAARHGHLTGAETPQQCAQKVVAGAHLAGQLVGDLGAVDMGCINFIGTAADHADIRTQLAQNLQGRHNVTDTGQIFNQTFPTRQNCGRQNSNRGVLCAANVDIANKRLPPANNVFFQV